MSDRTDAATRDPSAPDPEPDPVAEPTSQPDGNGATGGADGFTDWFDREFEGDLAPERKPDVDLVPDVEPAPLVDRAIDEPQGRGGDDPVDRPDLVGRTVRRIFRRPTEWATSDWPTRRIVEVVFTVFSLAVTTAIMMNVVHFNPLSSSRDLVFDNTTPTGGDFGAHVWGPAFLRDHLLPSWRLNGWSMDWYGGMPTYRFYMVVPALLVVAVDSVLAYGVALKLVAVSGLLTLPVACWAFGRLGRFRYPIPELFAFAGLAFALDESFSIYGGNLKSTMAGEFSFSIALSLGILGLGLLSAGLRTGKYRVWTAVVLAAACCSHGIVLIFVAFSAVIICLLWIDRTRLVYATTVGITTVLLLIWWVGPFLLDHAYMTDMKYGARPQGAEDSFWDMFFPLTAPLDILITSLAVIGFVSAVMRRHLTGSALGVIGLVFVAGVYLTQDSLPVIGLLWNPRLLPFVYLVRYLLMMVGAVEVLTIVWNLIIDRRASVPADVGPTTAFAGLTALVVLVTLGWMFQVLPNDGTRIPHGDKAVYAWGPFRATETNTDALGDGWAKYNFKGYQGRAEYYTEYEAVVRTMERLGLDPDHGCGRAMWENNEDNGKYGTTMALMLLPHWTDGCIGSMEGLFFEASGTTPYHFLAVASMSKQSSNPVRELRYENTNAAIGVREMRALGVRYAMVRTPEAKQQAAAQPELVLVASSGPWDIYEVTESVLIEPLTVQPVVVRGRPGDARERNLELGTSWFQHPEEWAAMPADDGPPAWQRISVQVDLERREGEPGGPGRKVDIVEPVEPIEPVALPPVEVTDVRVEQQSLSFSVDQVGVPVVVKVSYFPNWEASGALGPYRIGPNMMVVVPTATDVELTYGRSGADWLFTLLAIVGVALCVFWRVRGDVRHAADVPVFGSAAAEPDPSMPPRVVADHDPWDPQRFEPHGIADEDRWIRPRPTTTDPAAPLVADAPDTSEADTPGDSESSDDPDPPDHRQPRSWSEQDPEPPVDPTR
jgi:hypothetical protein